jgi:hypothetical protein
MKCSIAAMREPRLPKDKNALEFSIRLIME